MRCNRIQMLIGPPPALYTGVSSGQENRGFSRAARAFRFAVASPQHVLCSRSEPSAAAIDREPDAGCAEATSEAKNAMLLQSSAARCSTDSGLSLTAANWRSGPKRT
jgi:hypothetical protein